MPQRQYPYITYDDHDYFQFETLGLLVPNQQTDDEAMELAILLSGESHRLSQMNTTDAGDIRDKSERAERTAREIYRVFPPAYRGFLFQKIMATMENDERN